MNPDSNPPPPFKEKRKEGRGEGREGKGREGKGREGKGREGKEREGKIHQTSLVICPYMGMPSS